MWQKDLRNDTRKAFFEAHEKWRVLLLWPALHEWSALDNRLNDELGNFDSNVCIELMKKPEGTYLWMYMDEVMADSTTQLIIRMIRRIREQNNVFGKPRKMLISSFKLFNALMMHFILLKMAEDETNATIKSEDDWVFIRFFKQNKKDHSDLLEEFKSNNDGPGILNAVASQVSIGLSLQPADVVLVIDGAFGPNQVKQTTGRVSRASNVQKAPVTDSYRIVVTTNFGCNISDWLRAREFNRAFFCEQIEKSRKDLQRELGDSEVIHVSDDEEEMADG